jgi:hypothetical protein
MENLPDRQFHLEVSRHAMLGGNLSTPFPLAFCKALIYW